MKRSRCSVLVSLALASTVGNGLYAAELATSISISPSNSPYYSPVNISIENTGKEDLDLAKAKILIEVPSSFELTSAWGEALCPANACVISAGTMDNSNRLFKLQIPAVALISPGQAAQLTIAISTDRQLTENDVTIKKVTTQADLSGVINITAPVQPHPSLPNAKVLIENDTEQTIIDIPWGSIYPVENLEDGTYSITTLPVSSHIGIAEASETTAISLTGAEPAQANISYHGFKYYAAIELSLPISNAILTNISAMTTIKDQTSGEILNSMKVPFGTALFIEKLFEEPVYAVEFDPVTVNNIRYVLAPLASLKTSHDQPLSIAATLTSQPIDTASFSDVTVNVTGLPDGGATSLPDVVITNNSSGEIYVFNMANSQKNIPSMLVKPGLYSVKMSPVNIEGNIYQLDMPTDIEIAGNTFWLNLPFKEGVRLAVKGFPDYVANGTVTNDGENLTPALGRTKVDVIFKYAGISGSGDPGVILAKDELPLHRTLRHAREIAQLQGKPVLPLMVVYTANASGGAEWSDMTEADKLYKHYATFMTQAIAAQEYAGPEGQSPMSFILNPDFLGELQKNPDTVNHLNQEGSIAVEAQFDHALEYLKQAYGFELKTPRPQFANTLNGYIESLNYIMHAMAPDVSYGWQINLWAVGSAIWLYEDDDKSSESAQQVSSFVESLKVYSGNYQPDFIVFDKYERDGFGPEAPFYRFNASSWMRYLNYAKEISDNVRSPVMLWQIPGGHMPTDDEGSQLIDPGHYASGGSFFMGDSRIGKDITKIYDPLLNMGIEQGVYNVSNVQQLLARDQGYDWATNQMQSLPKYNVFALLWGGGSTVAVAPIGSNGNDGGWLNTKVNEYVANPSCLSGADCNGAIWGGTDEIIPEPTNSAPTVTVPARVNANVGEEKTITAQANDADGDPLSYLWRVDPDLTIISGQGTDTLLVKATKDIERSYPISIAVSDGALSTSQDIAFMVKGEGGIEPGEGECAGIADFEQRQYPVGEQVIYQNSLYQAQRWTDSTSTPTTPYSGWSFITTCQ